ncbi:DUF6779 domain-containing protein [Corynebacterium sanguinis]|uniref:DUF6779 domain-containing protein n=1 Tax=Corynebacterium sanguinis TaxID=2594913 RepID=UPI00223A876F|nr:DUF6779 domain-containing protein [Corynebacterium sanguinis]MCT1585077.1 hypothetical protein [Corynebacterium sanguinis]
MNAENTKRDNATLWIVVPFALAIVGTVVMLFTNSANVLKVSLILALWAAVAGIILVTRLRRDRDQAQRELVARSERFEAELDAAQARGEADRVLLERARSGSDTASSIDVEVLREIQAELARLRAQLEELSGRYFEYEPAALRAQARRIAELEEAAGSSKVEPVEPEPVAPEPEPKPVEPEPVAEVAEPVEPEPVATKPASGPSTDDTAKLQRVRESAPAAKRTTPAPGPSRPVGAPTFDAVAGRVGERRETLNDAHNPLSKLISERQAERFEEPAQPAPKPAPKPAPEPAPKPEAHGGRRRRDEHGRSSLTVAELLARAERNAE